MTKAKISVIIPIYNTAEYLEETLISILNQSIIDDIEVLMIDDGSIDESRYIIERYALDYDNFHAFHNEHEGQAVARNYGLDIAEGEFVHFLDSDDWIAPDAYERLYELAVSDNFDFAVGNVLRFGEDTFWQDHLFKNSFKGLDSIHRFKSINEHPPLVWDTSASNKLYRREFLQRNNIRFPDRHIFYEDLLFSIETYVKSDRFCFLNEHFYFWRLRPDFSSVSQKSMMIKNFRDRLEIIRLIRELVSDADVSDRTLNALYEKWLVHDLKMFIKNFHEYDPGCYEGLLDEISDVISDIPQSVMQSLKSYHKILYRMIENRDIEGLLYFAPLEDALKRVPDFELGLDEDYLKLTDFKGDSHEEKLEAHATDIRKCGNDLLIEFNAFIAYLGEVQSDNISPSLVDEDGQEYPLDIEGGEIVMSCNLIGKNSRSRIKMTAYEGALKREAYLKNYTRQNFQFADLNVEIAIGMDNVLFVSSRKRLPDSILIDEVRFDGGNFIFEGFADSEITTISIENITDFRQFSYPVSFSDGRFGFEIPHADIAGFPIRKWELKADHMIRLAKNFSFFKNLEEIAVCARDGVILIEDGAFDISDRIGRLNENIDSLSQENSMLLQKNRKLKRKNRKLKKAVREYESRRIVRIADKINESLKWGKT